MTKIKKRGLGKGLSALIPEMSLDGGNELEGQEKSVKHISINKILANKNQPRKNFDKEGIEELAQSIKQHGVIQPIIVAKDNEKYVIIAGERRWRAAKEAQLEEIPCLVREYNQLQEIEIALIENLQREDLNVIEEALAYKYIINNYKITQEKLASSIGKSRPYLANTVRLLQLDTKVIDLISEGSISSGHGRALLRIEDKQKQYKVAMTIKCKKINVRQTEELVELILSQKNNEKKKESKKDTFVLEVEDSLKKLFGTKVNILQGKKSGKIEIEYYGEEELERILELLEKIK
ncbi:MAG: ParB/RepB/Spo0J family partition protein [Clostridiales bacterium]|nr:ParB/RepB/Spo0J family partition protein [Clostridiales bacterium]